MTTVADALYQYGGMPVGPSGVPVPFTGNWWFVDPTNGADGNNGKSPGRAFQTLYKAHAQAASGNNDVVILIGNGSAILSLANAQSVTPAATTGTLTWSKNQLHLLGISGPTVVGQQAVITTPSGTYTQATFNSGNIVNVTGTGCYFANVQARARFSTGGVNQILWTEGGGGNTYSNMSFRGMDDAASAADTGSHSLLVASNDNTFVGGTIGLDTRARSSGISEMIFTTAARHNYFQGVTIQTNAGAAGCFWASIGAAGIDMYVTFSACAFINPTLGSPSVAATAMTVGMSINASAGGVVILLDCISYGATKITTTGLAFTNQAAGAAGGGLGVAIT